MESFTPWIFLLSIASLGGVLSWRIESLTSRTEALEKQKDEIVSIATKIAELGKSTSIDLAILRADLKTLTLRMAQYEGTRPPAPDPPKPIPSRAKSWELQRQHVEEAEAAQRTA